MPDPLLSRVNDLPADPVDLERWVRERSVTKQCPICGNTWEFYDGKGSGLERFVARRLRDDRCPDCYQKSAGSAQELPRDVFLRKAGVPELFRERQFLDPPHWPRDGRKEFAGIDIAAWRGQPWCVGFRGPTGTGKTFFAVELLYRNRAEFREPRFVLAAEWASLSLGSAGFGEREDAYLHAKDAPLLVLDDIGWLFGEARGTTAKEQLLNELLTVRHARRLKTIWTANHSVRQMTERLPAAMRRLEEGPVLVLSEKDAWGVNGEPPQGFKQLSISPEGR